MRILRVGLSLFLLLLMYAGNAPAQWVLQSVSFPAYDHDVGILTFCAVDTNVVWALADGGLVGSVNQFTRTTDGGANWIYNAIAGTEGLDNRNITAVNDQIAWVAMRGRTEHTSGGVFKTTDGGGTWLKQVTAYPGSGGSPMFIHFWNADSGLVVGILDNDSAWEIYTTANGGATWTLVPLANIPPLLPLETLIEPDECVVLHNTFWFGTSKGRILKSTDRGYHWTAAAVEPATQHEVHSIAFQDDSVGLATYFLMNEKIPTTYKTTTGGRTWFPIDPPLVPRPHMVTHVPGTTGVYVISGHLPGGGDNPGSAYTLNGGMSWTTVDNRTYLLPAFVTPTIGWVWARTEPDGAYGIYRWSGNLLVPSPNARLLVSRSAVDLGFTEIGRSSDTSVVSLYNAGVSPLSISSIALLHGQASFGVLANPKVPALIETGTSAELKIIFTPTRQGVVSDTLVMVSNDPLSPISRIALTGNTYSIAQAQPGVLYTVIGSADSSRLASVNTSSGVATAIGQTGYSPIVSMAVHPSTREIIGLVATSTSSSALVRINSSGGDAHPLSAITIPNPKGLTFGQDGVLYVGTFNARVYSMNYMTGAAIETVLTNPPIRIAGLTSDGAGQLWACVRPSSGPLDGIYTINFSTGKTTLVGYTGLGGRVLDILFYKGILYGITDSTGPNRNSLIQINAATGAGTVMRSTGFSNVQALAAIPDNATNIRETLIGVQPTKIELEQNYPNPFNPATTFSFRIPSQSFVSLKVFDALGRNVATLASEEMSAGRHTMRWDASKVPSGIYYYRLHAGAFTETRKAVLLK